MRPDLQPSSVSSGAHQKSCELPDSAQSNFRRASHETTQAPRHDSDVAQPNHEATPELPQLPQSQSHELDRPSTPTGKPTRTSSSDCHVVEPVADQRHPDFAHIRQTDSLQPNQPPSTPPIILTPPTVFRDEFQCTSFGEMTLHDLAAAELEGLNEALSSEYGHESTGFRTFQGLWKEDDDIKMPFGATVDENVPKPNGSMRPGCSKDQGGFLSNQEHADTKVGGKETGESSSANLAIGSGSTGARKSTQRRKRRNPYAGPPMDDKLRSLLDSLSAACKELKEWGAERIRIAAEQASTSSAAEMPVVQIAQTTAAPTHLEVRAETPASSSSASQAKQSEHGRESLDEVQYDASPSELSASPSSTTPPVASGVEDPLPQLLSDCDNASWGSVVVDVNNTPNFGEWDLTSDVQGREDIFDGVRHLLP